MGFNSAFKGLKFLKKTGNRRLNNLNDPVLNVLIQISGVLLYLIFIDFLLQMWLRERA
jgi:hypothetical protein